VNPKSGHLLRYPPDTFAEELPYRRFTRTWRRGKHLVFDLELARGGELRHLVVNPMLGGRFQLAAPDTKEPATRVFSLRLDGGDELRYLDFRDMGRIYWTADPAADVLAWPEMGPEADAIAGEGLDAFRKRLRRYRDELKDLLRNQAFLAGIGNAYSDEILHRARLSPVQMSTNLSDEEIATLFDATREVMAEWIDRLRAEGGGKFPEKVTAFRPEMAVHGKYNEPCPVCGSKVQRIVYAENETNYCARCQTGGKLLADRALSRLLHGDWPKSIDDL
jgi:formamidopyrimidine-DNA glycosylase